MQIHVIEYLDDELQEAIIEISSDEISLIAFSYPFKNHGSNDDIVLYGFMTEHIIIESSFKLPQKTYPGRFGYHLTAKVLDSSERIVQVGDIKIMLSISLPKDIPNGAFVSFDVARLDYDP